MKRCLRKIVAVLDLDRQEFLSEIVQVEANSQSGAILFFLLLQFLILPGFKHCADHYNLNRS